MTESPVYDLWRGNAARIHHGICGSCSADTMVARQEHARSFQCVDCFASKPTGSADLRRRVRAIVRETKRKRKAAA